MGVLSVTEAQEAANGSVEKSGGRKYSAPYLVKVEYATDGPVAILNHFRDNGPWVGSTFSYGNETDTTVKCTGITAPQRVPSSREYWTCSATYEAPDSQEEKKDHEGNPTETPADFRMNIQSNSASFQVPVGKAWNIDAFPVPGKTSSFERAAGTLGPVVNSAGVVLDPPLMTQASETVWRVTGYHETLMMTWLDDTVVNRINALELTWDELVTKHYGVESDVFDPYTIKVTSAGASVKWWRDIVYYEYQFEFRIRRRAEEIDDIIDGWLEYVLDRGISRRAGAADPDGTGGTVNQADIEEGMARVAPILDVTGRRTPELILLDGAGQPATGDDEKEGVWFAWRVNRLLDILPCHPLKIFKST